MFSPTTGRISNSTISRNYNRQLLGSQRLSNELAYRIGAESRRFTSMAENTSGGVRAMELRRNIERLHSHRDNAQAALSLVEAAEGQLSNAFELVKQVRERVLQANTDTSADPDTRPDVIAGQLRHMRDSMITIMNGRFGDRFLFGGTIIDRPPFTYDPNDPDIHARLTFRGENVMTTLNEASIEFDPFKHEFVKRPTYLDVGLGLAFDEYGNVDPNTAYRNSFDGLQIFGESDMNIIFIMDQMIAELERHATGQYSHDNMGALLDRFDQASQKLSLEIVRIGSDANQLRFMIDRFDSEEINLEDRRTQIEREDPEKLIMDWKMAEFAYNAALQMGQRVLMPSLWDYMR
jgi:flagellar hook-associated protein 3 FlgL